MSSGIYCILCTANGKRYVGQSVAMKRRLTAHLSRLRRGVHYNAHLQAAFQKYGAESFETSVLEECAEDMLDIRERAWISYYQSTNPEFGFNRESGGNAQKHISDETRARMSDARRKRHISNETRARIAKTLRQKLATPEARAKMSEARRGKAKSDEHRRRISEALRGKTPSAETRVKLTNANLGRKHTPEAKARMSDVQRQRAATPEDRAHRSEVMKLYWARKKAAATHHEGDK